MKTTSNNFLIYSRAAYLRGIEEQKRRTNFSNMQAVLSLHDAVEFCVRAVTEEFDLRPGQQDSLMQMFRLIDKHFELQQPAKKLPRESQIRFLDATRGKVKHHASVPSSEDTEQCLSHATYFLEQVSQEYFQVPFERVSLVALLEEENLRQILYKSEECLAEGQYLQALVLAKVAYTKGLPSADLFLGVDQFRNRHRSLYYPPNLSVRASTGSMTRGSHAEVHVDTSGISKAIHDVAKHSEVAVEIVKSQVDRLERSLVQMIVGGDVLAFKRFEEITPRVGSYIGETSYYWLKDKVPTVQMAQEALSYVVEMLLRWQDMGVLQTKQAARNIYRPEDWEEIAVTGLNIETNYTSGIED